MKRLKKKEKQSGKRTALLALAAHYKDNVGPCLSPEEMAILVDQGFSDDKKRVYHEHLSCCDACYKEWVFLSKKKLEDTAIRRKSRIISFFSRPKNLALIGSSFAVAVSLVIFLNIHQNGLEVSTNEEKPIPSIQKMPVGNTTEHPSPAPPVTSGKQEGKGKAPTSQNTIKRSAPEPVKRKMQATADSSILESEEEQTHLAPPAETERSQGAKGAQIQSKHDGGFFPEMSSWLHTVRKACNQEEYAPMAWEKIHIDAQTLQNKMKRNKYRQEKNPGRIFLNLSNITTTTNEENWSHQCRKILLLLEQETGKR